LKVQRLHAQGLFKGKNFDADNFCYESIGNKKSTKDNEQPGGFVFNNIMDHLSKKINCTMKKRKLATMSQRGISKSDALRFMSKMA
jgi:hypothetical protein